MRTRHSEVEPQHGEWTLGCPRASPPASPYSPPPPLHQPPPLPITSFDTPKACCGCLCLWAPEACSLYTVRGCKSGSITARTRTGSFSLSLSKFNSVLSLSGCSTIKYSCEHKTPRHSRQQIGSWFKRKKNTHTQTQTLTHRQCTTTEY